MPADHVLSDRARGVAMALLALEFLGIAWLVLNPSPATPTGAVYKVSAFVIELGGPSWMASTTGWEYLFNVALFVPLGLLAALVWEQVLLEEWVVLGFAVSAALELGQLTVLGERSATVSDLSANTIGTFLGAGSAALVLSVLTRRTARKRDTVLV